jgi:hypothetical protein
MSGHYGCALLAMLSFLCSPLVGQGRPVPDDSLNLKLSKEPIIVHGDEQGRVNLSLPDGGLAPLVGVQNFQVFRASRGRPDAADKDGWTYAHHQDLACWKGRLYAAWAMTPVDEDVPPYKVVYATSTDGCHWSAPADLFPRQMAWACRFYFYRASNGRMLALTAGKSADGTVSEAAKKVLLVREITSDHGLNEVFTLVTPLPDQPPFFETARDSDFVAACREAVANNLLLEQQDYGRFLGERRIKWHENPPKFNGFYPFGKALCFYHRLDGLLIGLSKMGFVTVSDDQGTSWSVPMLPSTLIAGSAKIWGQRMADGRFALAYNPDRGKRYPLVLVHGEDGCEFRDMRVIHGELPRRRYSGKYKDLGAQYVRGLAEWSNDGTFADKQVLWLIYSVNKEDIWVARVPLPIKPDETKFPFDDWQRAPFGNVVPGWNVYSPRWAPVTLVEESDSRCLELRDGDPFDYCRAVRVFPVVANMRLEFRVRAAQTNACLEIELCDATGNRPVRVALAENGRVQACDGADMVQVATFNADAWTKMALTVDLAAGIYTMQVNRGKKQSFALADKTIHGVERLSFRTGPWRGCSDGGEVDAKQDVPMATPAVFLLSNVKIRPLKN